MRAGVLRGRDVLGIDRIACTAEGRVALALCQGGASKTYAHKHPNEDSVGFGHGAAGALLLAADGHGGCQAAELAVAEVLRTCGPAWTEGTVSREAWAALASGAAERAHTAIVAAGSAASAARTTLSLALARPAEGWLGWASVGDSHVFRVEREQAIECGPADVQGIHVLGNPRRSLDELEMRSGTTPLGATQALVLATDGISEPGIGLADPAAAVRDASAAAARAAPELRPLEAVRGLVERALEAQRAHRAGDNVAAAVYWAAD
jgi:serine/threonine protein phosphatase PrpC